MRGPLQAMRYYAARVILSPGLCRRSMEFLCANDCASRGLAIMPTRFAPYLLPLALSNRLLLAALTRACPEPGSLE